MKASKLTARSLAYALRAVGRKIAKEYAGNASMGAGRASGWL